MTTAKQSKLLNVKLPLRRTQPIRLVKTLSRPSKSIKAPRKPKSSRKYTSVDERKRDEGKEKEGATVSGMQRRITEKDDSNEPTSDKSTASQKDNKHNV